jgi:chloramphenicol-sensitive protein RarD
MVPSSECEMIRPDSTANSELRMGVLYALLAYGAWGLVAIYFHAVREVPAHEVLLHRIVWALAILLAWLGSRGKLMTIRRALSDRRVLLSLVGSTVLIGLNWYTFTWAAANEYLLQASLGYFINPLLSILLGLVFLRERLTRMQTVAVLLALAGVVALTMHRGSLPVIALVLACSFGLYGLLRKICRVDAATGLAIETSFLFPFAAGYMIYLIVQRSGHFTTISWRADLMLMFAGVVTALPLVWFANAARRLPLRTLGFLQYIAPSGQFLLAVWAFGEKFGVAELISFGCIWVALGIYSTDTILRARAAVVRA